MVPGVDKCITFGQSSTNRSPELTAIKDVKEGEGDLRLILKVVEESRSSHYEREKADPNQGG